MRLKSRASFSEKTAPNCWKRVCSSSSLTCGSRSPMYSVTALRGGDITGL